MAPHVMTKDELIRPAGRPATPALPTWLGRIAQKLIASWAWYDTYRHTAHELGQLTDRELDDIGIPRCDIPAIAMEAANDAQKRR